LDFITLVLIAFSLSLDAFAVSIGVGAAQSCPDRRSKLRLALHFGIFQALMPLLGWLVGATAIQFIGQFDHWIALGLLGYVGMNMILSGLKRSAGGSSSDQPCNDPSRGRTLVMLSIATSIDAFAVGLSLGLLKVLVLLPALFIGLVTFTLSIAGLFLSQKLGEKFGKWMEIAGGVVLIAIGLRILITHLSL
jgi:putative Mn2+ efflux pump MntP